MTRAVLSRIPAPSRKAIINQQGEVSASPFLHAPRKTRLDAGFARVHDRRKTMGVDMSKHNRNVEHKEPVPNWPISHLASLLANGSGETYEFQCFMRGREYYVEIPPLSVRRRAMRGEGPRVFVIRKRTTGLYAWEVGKYSGPF